MADEDDTISFDNLTEASQHKANQAILSRVYDDPDIQHIIDGMKQLQAEESKKTLTVKVDGVHTEVRKYDRQIYVYVSGIETKVYTIYYNCFYSFTFLVQVFYDADGLAYYWSKPKTETTRPNKVFITGDNARASKSVKKQFLERTTPVDVNPENLDVKFGYI